MAQKTPIKVKVQKKQVETIQPKQFSFPPLDIDSGQVSETEEGKFNATAHKNDLSLQIGSPKRRDISIEHLEKHKDFIKIYPSNMIPKINPGAHILHMMDESKSRSRMSSEEDGPIRIITD